MKSSRTTSPSWGSLVIQEAGVGEAATTSSLWILNKKTTFPAPNAPLPSLWGVETQAFRMLQNHHSCIFTCCILVLPLSGCPPYLPLWKRPLDKPRVIKISCLTLTTRQLLLQSWTHTVESVSPGPSHSSFKIRPLFCWLRLSSNTLGDGEGAFSGPVDDASGFPHSLENSLSSTTYHWGARIQRPRTPTPRTQHCPQAGKDPGFLLLLCVFFNLQNVRSPQAKYF